MSDPAIPVHHLEEDGSWRVRVQRIAPRTDALRSEVHRHDFHEIFFLAHGDGTHMIDLRTHAFHAPCMHAIAPGQVHRLERSADSSGLVVMFQREVLQGAVLDEDLLALFAPIGNGPVWNLRTDQLNEAVDLVAMIERETANSGTVAPRVASGLLGVLLAKCAEWASTDRPATAPPTPPAGPDIVRRFLGDMERDFLHERRPSAYAERYAVTTDHLSDLLRKRMGKSITDVLQERLVLEAKRLLLHSTMSVKEVGFALNLEDPAYFSRLFKKATGETPGDYRERIRDLYTG